MGEAKHKFGRIFQPTTFDYRRVFSFLSLRYVYFWCSSTNSVAILAQEQENQIQNLFPKKAAQLVEAFPMVLFSVQLLILLTVASSTRVNDEEIGHKAITQHFQDSEASEPLPQFGEASELLPQFGEASAQLPQF